MYSVGLVLESINLLAKLTALHVWGEQTGFEIQAVCTSVDTFRELLRERNFDLVVVECKLVEANDYKLLKKFKNNKSCGHIALCSASGDFEAARKGIVLGIDDYFTLPFSSENVLALFKRITSQEFSAQYSFDDVSREIFELFIKHDDKIRESLEGLYSQGICSDVLDNVIARIFDENDWLDLYVNENDFLSLSSSDVEAQISKFTTLYENHKNLLPSHNETLEQIINYILYNPESDLRQKSISEELHINKSYLSTVFIAQTGVRFVDYITNIKLMRAAWLLRNSQMKVSEIAQRMDYKDTAYFSKQFKKSFNITPSEYRLPDDYHFEI